MNKNLIKSEVDKLEMFSVIRIKQNIKKANGCKFRELTFNKMMGHAITILKVELSLDLFVLH